MRPHKRIWPLRGLIVAALMALLPLPARAQTEPARPLDYRAFRNGHWWDGKQFVHRDFYSVEGDLRPNPLPMSNPAVIDLAGGYVLPACAEAHNHAAVSDQPKALERFISQGILYAKNPANIPRVRTGSLINTPQGVDVIFANGSLTAPEGHPLILVRRGGIKKEEGEGSFYHSIDSVADLRAKLPKLLASKPDFVKTILVYSEEYKKRRFRPEFAANDPYFSRRGLDPSLMSVIVKEVHKHGLPVVAHVESAADFHVAVEAGVNEINHLPGFWPADDAIKSGDFERYRIADVDARTAGRRKIDVVLTIGETLDNIAAMPDSPAKRNLLAVFRDNLAKLRKNGVRILMGSDEFKKSSRNEVLAIAAAGLMTTPELIKSWCEITPQAIFPRRKIGKLRDGYEANFLVLKADPLQDINNVKNVRYVFKRGRQLFPAAKRNVQE